MDIETFGHMVGKLGRLALFIAFVFLMSPNAPAVEALGIVGDSGTTGAATDPNLTISYSSLGARVGRLIFKSRYDLVPRLEVFSVPNEFHVDEDSFFPPPFRIFSYPEEILDRRAKVLFEGISSTMLDVEEYSFGFLVGKKLGLSNDKIIFVGKDGVGVESIYKQFERLQHWPRLRRAIAWTPTLTQMNLMTQRITWSDDRPYLPDLVIVSLTGNNFCRTGSLDWKDGFLREKYFNTFVSELSQVVTRLPPHPKGTSVYVLAAFNLLQAKTNADALVTEVLYHGQPMSCKRVREDKDAFEFLSANCKALFRTNGDPAQQLEKVQKLYSEVVSAQEMAVEEMQKKAPEKFKFRFVKATSDIWFSKGDLANDCFHPSAKGHEKIARTVLNELL